jgi:hypothetical protein
MGNYQKYLTNLDQTFTDVKALKVMNVYTILIIYLIPEKNIFQKVCFKSNLKRLVQLIQVTVLRKCCSPSNGFLP